MTDFQLFPLQEDAAVLKGLVWDNLYFGRLWCLEMTGLG